MRAHKLLAAFAVMIASPALLIAACKSSDEPEEVAPAPGAVTAPTATAPPPAATGTVPAATAPPPAATGTVPAATPTPAAPPATTTAAPTPAAPATPKPDAGAPADAGAPKDAGTATTADAGALSTKLAACAAKCQTILQTCLTPKFPADGGLPALADPAACQGSFDSCRTACAP
ncbi:hypothetical protein [Sorangium sp. So ce128]|uniref:hypothetical protein n=1 Tax=Sorangium sp. So ce128 TaxID=3133281 RepID=UPI003F61E43E